MPKNALNYAMTLPKIRCFFGLFRRKRAALSVILAYICGRWSKKRQRSERRTSCIIIISVLHNVLNNSKFIFTFLTSPCFFTVAYLLFSMFFWHFAQNFFFDSNILSSCFLKFFLCLFLRKNCPCFMSGFLHHDISFFNNKFPYHI